MPRHTRRTRASNIHRPHQYKKSPQEMSAEQDDKNKAKFLAPQGVVAQDLPDAKHGMNVVDSPKQKRRNLPQQHGGTVGDHAEGGMRGDRNVGAAAKFGGRGKN